jgi:hypothetical protein
MFKAILEWWFEWCAPYLYPILKWFFIFLLAYMACSLVAKFYIVVFHRPFKFLLRHLRAYMQSRSEVNATA